MPRAGGGAVVETGPPDSSAAGRGGVAGRAPGESGAGPGDALLRARPQGTGLLGRGPGAWPLPRALSPLLAASPHGGRDEGAVCGVSSKGASPIIEGSIPKA